MCVRSAENGLHQPSAMVLPWRTTTKPCSASSSRSHASIHAPMAAEEIPSASGVDFSISAAKAAHATSAVPANANTLFIPVVLSRAYLPSSRIRTLRK